MSITSPWRMGHVEGTNSPHNFCEEKSLGINHANSDMGNVG
jgi:hypothetical protein